MAKGQYRKWLEKENLILLQGWKRNGLTDEQIANNIGIRRETLYAWKNRFPNINNALKIGHDQANYAVESELFKKAVQGNTTAMIFWLKNNWRDKYNDSELSPEERQLINKRTEKLEADIEHIKLQNKALAQLDGTDNTKLAEIAKLLKRDDEHES